MSYPHSCSRTRCPTPPVQNGVRLLVVIITASFIASPPPAAEAAIDFGSAVPGGVLLVAILVLIAVGCATGDSRRPR